MDDSQFETTGSVCKISIQESQLNQQEDIFQILDTVLEKGSPTHIVLDCKDIQRINSTGIGRLVYIKRYLLDEKKVTCELLNLNPHILKTLRSVKVDHLLGIDN